VERGASQLYASSIAFRKNLWEIRWKGVEREELVKARGCDRNIVNALHTLYHPPLRLILTTSMEREASQLRFLDCIQETHIGGQELGEARGCDRNIVDTLHLLSHQLLTSGIRSHTIEVKREIQIIYSLDCIRGK